MRKTKIVCTIGPASEELSVLKRLMEAGMNVARLNFSHGSHEEHARRIERIRQAAKETGRTIALLLDTKGPEIRTGDLREGIAELQEGETFTLTTEPVLGDASRVSVSYAGLAEDVEPGATILIDDGLIKLTVIEVRGPEIICRVVNSGVLKNRKGVNVPGVRDPAARHHLQGCRGHPLRSGAGHRFHRRFLRAKKEDVLEIRKLLEEQGRGYSDHAKIENQEGLDNLDSILEVADGLMVARGDLGVEIPVEEVPLVQKRMIEPVQPAGKPVITATQMLDSMQRNPVRPARKRATSPTRSWTAPTRSCCRGRRRPGNTRWKRWRRWRASLPGRRRRSNTGICSGSGAGPGGEHHRGHQPGGGETAQELDATAIITSTESGHTARMVSKYRPRAPIVAVTPHERVMRKLALVWGVHPVKGRAVSSTDEMLQSAIDSALASKTVRHGDLVVITAGVPVGQPGTTNLIKVHVISDVLAKGQGVGRQVVTGRAVVGVNAEEIRRKMTDGAILVTLSTDRDMIDVFKRAKAVVTEEGGLTSHGAVVGISLGIPVIVGVEGALQILKDGMEITVDSERGYIYSGRANVL